MEAKKTKIEIEYLRSAEGGSNGESTTFYLTKGGLVSHTEEPYADDEAIVSIFGDQIEELPDGERKKLLETLDISEKMFKDIRGNNMGYYCGNCQSTFPNKDCPRCRENF